jgi:hypothetical protein
MKYANEIFFFVFALILWGLLYGSRFILTADKTSQPKKLWLTALTLTATSFTLFALASTIKAKGVVYRKGWLDHPDRRRLFYLGTKGAKAVQGNWLYPAPVFVLHHCYRAGSYRCKVYSFVH